MHALLRMCCTLWHAIRSGCRSKVSISCCPGMHLLARISKQGTWPGAQLSRLQWKSPLWKHPASHTGTLGRIEPPRRETKGSALLDWRCDGQWV